MDSLKRIITTRLLRLAVTLVLLILPVATVLETQVLQNQAQENAHAAFQQISQILEENQQELQTITEEYRTTCLHNAEAIAYMIQYHPEILGNIEEFRMIARMMEVDEIHIFDKTGCIFTGTHPEYYNYTFETGEQIGFFAPLLEDKSLRLCQDVTPNTAEGVLVQYSALWSADGEFIVQVGMYPETIMAFTEKNEFSYIFSLLQGPPGVEFYAIDSQSGTILGSSAGNVVNRNMRHIGLELEDLPRYLNGARATVSGIESYCVFTDLDGTLLAYVIATDALYHSVPLYTVLLAVSLSLIVCVIITLLWRFTRDYIIRGIDRVNNSLALVSDGNLDERVEVRSSLEFSELSDHINHMIRSILSTTDKMGFVLDHTDMRIGVYEYSAKMKTVRFTDHVPEILDWSPSDLARFSSDHCLLQEYISQVTQNRLPGEKNIFRLSPQGETYIQLEELVNGPDTLGILIDVTEVIQTRRRIEQERDIDLLTGLYNRRAMERELNALFQSPMGFGALVMVDSDSLKTINDVYGHHVGDRYIQQVAKAISQVGTAQQLSARLGGDEFVLLLHGYPTEEAVFRDLEELRHIQQTTFLPLEDGTRLPVEFSFGYVMTQGRTDHAAMLSEADGHMYAAKRKRKRTRPELTPQA